MIYPVIGLLIIGIFFLLSRNFENSEKKGLSPKQAQRLEDEIKLFDKHLTIRLYEVFGEYEQVDYSELEIGLWDLHKNQEFKKFKFRRTNDLIEKLENLKFLNRFGPISPVEKRYYEIGSTLKWNKAILSTRDKYLEIMEIKTLKKRKPFNDY